MDNLVSRVQAALRQWSGPETNAAWLLCDRHPEQAVAFTIVDDAGPVEVTFGELRWWSQCCAAGLRELGVGPGDRVATLMGKSFELVGVLVAIWRLGAVYVPLFTAFGMAAVETRLRRSGAKVVVVDPDQCGKFEEPVSPLPPGCRLVVAGPVADTGGVGLGTIMDRPSGELVPEAVAVGGDGAFLHLFTSGTTGAPKEVVHPLRFMAGWDVYSEYALGLTPAARYWCAADPGWGYGLCAAIIGPLSLGLVSVLVRGGFSVESTWRVLSDLGVTDFVAAPTAFRAMRASPLPAPQGLALARLSSAGEPLTAEINDWAREVLGVEVYDHFGQTEVGMIVANHHHPRLARALRPGSMGVEVPGWRLAVLRPGEDIPAASGSVGRLAVDVPASPLMGLAGNRDRGTGRFTADGRWYLTGDAASREETGEFFFSARDDDVIITAGYRIGPFDVESVIGRHPEVAECAVVAGPDALRGEIVEAFVVTRGEVRDEAALAAELQELVRRHVSAHAYPRQVRIRDQLPKTPSGKIQRFALRAELRSTDRDE